MKIFEVVNTQATKSFKTYIAKVKIQQVGYHQIIDAQVTARDLNTAIRLLKGTYGKNSLVGTPRVVGSDRR